MDLVKLDFYAVVSEGHQEIENTFSSSHLIQSTVKIPITNIFLHAFFSLDVLVEKSVRSSKINKIF